MSPPPQKKIFGAPTATVSRYFPLMVFYLSTPGQSPIAINRKVERTRGDQMSAQHLLHRRAEEEKSCDEKLNVDKLIQSTQTYADTAS